MPKTENGRGRHLPLSSKLSDPGGGGDHSQPNEDESIQSSGLSGESSIATGTSRTARTDVKPSRRQLEPIGELIANDTNAIKSSVEGDGYLQRVSTAEQKRSLEERRQNMGGLYTKSPSSAMHSSVSSIALSDTVIGIEQALEEQFLSTEPSSHSWENPSSAHIGIRTAFEVDDARGETLQKRRVKGPIKSLSISNRSGQAPALDSHLSDEQDAWAGIDELLESKSLDGSNCFSTTDILPSSTVEAMRRSSRFDDETIWGEDASESGESRAVSEFDSSKATPSKRFNQESWKSKEERERTRNDADLFRMFTWSDKDNVDEQRTRKVKLNNNALKMQMLAAQRGIPTQEPDLNTSLPSLATCKRDDFSVESDATSVDWSAAHSKASNFQASNPDRHPRDDLGFQTFHNFNVHSTIFEESFLDGSVSFQQSKDKLAGDGLVLDKEVDAYIRRIQQTLPSGKGKKKKEVGFALDEEKSSPSPISAITEEGQLDDLPSLTDLSRRPIVARDNVDKKGRKEQKKDPKPSLTLLMNSIKKKVYFKVKPSKKLGDEEKYFPEAVRSGGSNSKKFSANRCLLNQDGDGVNWDAE